MEKEKQFRGLGPGNAARQHPPTSPAGLLIDELLEPSRRPGVGSLWSSIQTAWKGFVEKRSADRTRTGPQNTTRTKLLAF